MKTSVQITIIIIIIFAMLLLLSSCFFVKKGMPSSINYGEYDDADKYNSGKFSYSPSGIKRVEIDWIAGELSAVVTESDTLSVSENGDSLDENAQLHYYSDGKTLFIKYCASRYKGAIDPEQKKLSIELPRGIELEIVSVSADVYSDELDMKEISISSVSGNTALTSATAENIRISTVSGDVHISDARALDELCFESVSGNIKNSLAKARSIESDSVSGDIELVILDAEDIDIDTTSGNVTLILSEGIGIDLDFSTVSGKLSTAPEHKEGTKICEVDVETVSGDLITKRNIKVDK